MLPYIWDNAEDVYYSPDTIYSADAFWLFMDYPGYHDIDRTPITEIVTTFYPGWNMISSINDTISIDIFESYDEIEMPIYYFDPISRGYLPAREIVPGIGYWLLTTERLDITYP